MLIGISGKISSGKDLTGKIIQYLTNPFDRDMQTQFDSNTDYSIGCSWKIKKFADKVKDIVCLLIGCTREQLEDREFKEKELGEEWWYYKVYESKVKGFVLYPYLENKNEYHIVALVKLTPRLLLQLLGTECGRNIIHPNVWVNALMHNYKLIDGDISNSPYTSDKQNNALKALKSYYPNWIITDMRFPNELKAVKDRGGISIRVNRPYSTVVGQGNGNWATFSDTQFHPSETSLDSATFDYVINNDGTIEELIEKVKQILILEKII